MRSAKWNSFFFFSSLCWKFLFLILFIFTNFTIFNIIFVTFSDLFVKFLKKHVKINKTNILFPPSRINIVNRIFTDKVWCLNIFKNSTYYFLHYPGSVRTLSIVHDKKTKTETKSKTKPHQRTPLSNLNRFEKKVLKLFSSHTSKQRWI